MNVLPILQADFVELCAAVAGGELGDVSWSFDRKATVCKYVVPEAYPEASPEAKIDPPRQQLGRDDIQWYWAACEQRGDDVYLTSSRSGAFVGLGGSLAEAEAAAEGAARSMAESCPVRYRPDIGSEEAIRRRVEHMASLRGSEVGSKSSAG
jgi:phosphoribosylamine--glycine ligase